MYKKIWIRKTHLPLEPRYRISGKNPFEPLATGNDDFEKAINDDKYIHHLSTTNQLEKHTNTKNNKRKPINVTNKLKGNNKQVLDRKQHKATVPQNGCKTVIIGTSMIKGIHIKGFNTYIKNGYANYFLEQK